MNSAQTAQGVSRPEAAGAIKDPPHITPDFAVKRDNPIDGVRLFEPKNMVTRNGVTTEVFRPDWGVAALPVEHVVHVSLRPGVVSAWHWHGKQTDHLFFVAGSAKAVLYDDRPDSPSRGAVNAFNVSPLRPTLLVIPPGLWHGIQSFGCSFVNYFDRPYNYEDPDEWRLPVDSPEIPYSF